MREYYKLTLSDRYKIILTKIMKNMKLWIARDEAVVPEDMEHFIERHPEKEIEFAKLHIFYDKPYWSGCDGKWYGARDMCEVPNYMFPEIKIGDCVEFSGAPIEY